MVTNRTRSTTKCCLVFLPFLLCFFVQHCLRGIDSQILRDAKSLLFFNSKYLGDVTRKSPLQTETGDIGFGGLADQGFEIAVFKVTVLCYLMLRLGSGNCLIGGCTTEIKPGGRIF